MEQMANLLQSLAAQLGTTAQYLWVVLVRQARVEAYTNIITIIIIFTLILAWVKVHFLLFKERDGGHNLYYEYEEAAVIPMGIIAIALLVLFIVAIAIIPETITCLVNPEYWALQKVLNTIKGQ